MKIINTSKLEEVSWESPKGTFGGSGKQVSEALGRKHDSTDLVERHPFDVEICRVPASKALCPYHSPSAQWAFYHVIEGTGKVRHADGQASIGPGDAFLFKPGEPHQILNNSEADLVFYIIADNPIGESCHYPDSGKWMVRSPESQLIRSEPIDYFDGEE
jgi:uncharacterized cupin superfamily protein